MSLYGMMRTSVSGMNAQAERLSTVADNVANASTTGYKRSAIEFQTHVLDATSGQYNSGSVNTAVRQFVSEQGALVSTTSNTDLAINGDGFFIVEDTSSDMFLTRAGGFYIDNVGNLVNSAGSKLMGYDLQAAGAPPVANGFGGLVPISVGSQELSAVATTEAILVPNLPSNAAVVGAANLPSANAATADYAGKTSMLMYDSLGNERLVDIYFAKTGTNTWEASVYSNADSTGGGFPYSSAALTTEALSFDASTGFITTGGTTDATFTLPGGASVLLDMSGISQLGTGYTVTTAATNGSKPATIERIEVGSDGVVAGVFDNGFSVGLYQLALANVPSADNLRAEPGNNYSVTLTSGDVIVGVAESETFGKIVAGALEESNVDMATELTIMIESQRSYTANSKVFQTGSDLMDVLINLKR
ncbi:MAG: flagellar hook protein FlgE [Nitratireductor sp.]